MLTGASPGAPPGPSGYAPGCFSKTRSIRSREGCQARSPTMRLNTDRLRGCQSSADSQPGNHPNSSPGSPHSSLAESSTGCLPDSVRRNSRGNLRKAMPNCDPCGFARNSTDSSPNSSPGNRPNGRPVSSLDSFQDSRWSYLPCCFPGNLENRPRDGIGQIA
jgi:hypothetical protein